MQGTNLCLGRHQKEAVSFIMSRETIQDANLKSLWRLDSYVSDSSVYAQ